MANLRAPYTKGEEVIMHNDDEQFRPPDLKHDAKPLETIDEYNERMGISPINFEDEDSTVAAKPKPLQAKKSKHKSIAYSKSLAILLLLICVIAIWEITTTIYQHKTALSDSDWKKLSALIKKEHKKGQPILVAPFWTTPIAYKHLGDRIDLNLASLSDVDRYKEVYLISAYGKKHPWLKGQKPFKEWNEGKIRLALFKKVPVEVIFDIRDRIKEAKVEITSPQTACRPSPRGFECRGRKYWVGKKLAEVGHKAYRCIYAHPIASKKISIRFDKVEIGKELVGYRGIDDFASRRLGKGNVMLDIYLDEEKIAKIVHHNDAGWKQFKANTEKYLGQRRTLRFEISTDNPAYRTFCFHAELRK